MLVRFPPTHGKRVAAIEATLRHRNTFMQLPWIGWSAPTPPSRKSARLFVRLERIAAAEQKLSRRRRPRMNKKGWAHLRMSGLFITSAAFLRRREGGDARFSETQGLECNDGCTAKSPRQMGSHDHHDLSPYDSRYSPEASSATVVGSTSSFAQYVSVAMGENLTPIL